ncbi:triose-phosphate transporter family-domain-containing protein [Lipomyces oligophaga]|uniref:triose-phosphate transporter family-domain-containing protein n=1 Tax=Lipomyces oligophaga TaxID=45792 RepID=UPI0034CFB655
MRKLSNPQGPSESIRGAGYLLASSSRAKAASSATLFVLLWITISSLVILFNKAILYNSRFPFPIFLTTWHLVFSSLATQVLARFTSFYSDRDLNLSRKVYWQRIVPVSVFYSLSLVCSNQAYVYLNIAFIQMLKATSPVAVFFISYVLRLESFRVDVLFNIWVIVFGVFVASFGEVNFSAKGMIIELLAIVFEAIRLVMMNKLMYAPSASSEGESSARNTATGEGKAIDPMVCLYYFAPICAFSNVFLFLLSNEAQTITFEAVKQVGVVTLTANAFTAFLLNVSVVSLIGRTSSLVVTLCGILKDIGLVFVSSLLWRTAITKLQVIGYFIALIGLFGYKFGYSPVMVVLQAADSKAYRKYYTSLTLRQRRRIVQGGLMVSTLVALMYYYSQHLRWLGGINDGAFESIRLASLATGGAKGEGQEHLRVILQRKEVY